MKRNNNRRDFLKGTAVAGVGYFVAAGVQAEESKSANEEIQFACIGVGGKGSSDSASAQKAGHIVAVCDVDANTLDKAAQRFTAIQKSDVAKFADYREMLDKLGDKIDAVTVSTPDHMHAAAAVAAMQMGKHAFVQKPMTHSIYEARRMGEIAAEKKLATQMGNQGTANSNLRKSAAIVKSGALGDVTEVHVWTNRPIWAQGGDRPKPSNVPEQLSWDLWLGVAPKREYASGYHPFAWRGWWDFGTGALGDMACHTMNMPFMALGLRDPVSVMAETSGHNKDSYPKSSQIVYEFPANAERGPLKMIWYDGGRRPDAALFGDEKPGSSGALIVGSKGKLYSTGDYGGGYKMLGVEEPTVEFTQSPGHFEEFAAAIKGGPEAVSNFPNYASPLSETVLLGNLAVYADGKKVMWDAKNLKATGAEGLDAIVKPTYENGYDQL